MAPKRKAQEPDAGGDAQISGQNVHTSRQFQIYGHSPNPSKKPRRNGQPSAVPRKQAHASSVNAIKKRIRNVKRKLEHSDGLPANIRVEDERALAAYHQDLVEAETEKIRQKMIKRYHMVRFFERQKATRQLKKLRKHLLEAESSNKIRAIEQQIHIAEVDLNYTQYSPLSEPYVSLYPQKVDPADLEADETKSAPKPTMWTEVEACMREGTLNQLRNRVSTTRAIVKPKPLEVRPAKPRPKPQATVDTTGMNRRQRRSHNAKDMFSGKTKNKSMAFERNQVFGSTQASNEVHEGGDDSDGGFFEE